MRVLQDADVASVVDWAMVGIFVTAGQICSATSRLLVHSSVADKMIDALVAAASRIRLGDPLDETTQMGAVISSGQHACILRMISTTAADGASLLIGGGAHRVEGLEGGYYVAPTIFKDVPVTSQGWKEEIFGPVLCIRRYL